MKMGRIIGLGFLFLGGLAVTALLYVAIVGRLEVALAEALEQTSGLRGYAFGWWATWIGLGVVALLTGVRWINQRRGMTVTPFALLWLYLGVHLVICWTLVALDATGTADMPVWLLAWTALTTEATIAIVLPMMLLVAGGLAFKRIATTTWQADSARGLVGPMIVFGLIALSFVGARLWMGEAGYDMDRPTVQASFSPGLTATQARHQAYAEATTIGPFSGVKPLTKVAPDACFRQLHHVQRKRCEARAWRIVHDRQTAEDVASEAMMKTCQKPRENPESYYVTACRTTALDALKDAKREVPPEKLPHPRYPPDGLQAVEQKRLIECLVTQLDAFPDPRSRRAVLLKWEGLSAKDIGRHLRTTEANVRQIFRRARIALTKACPQP